jgi:hypothetical protein
LKIFAFSMAALLSCGVAMASFKTSAPKGVDLSGRWKLSPELSEDPHAAVEVAREEMRDKNKDEKKKGRHRTRGGMRPPDENRGHLPPGETIPNPEDHRQPNDDSNDKSAEDDSARDVNLDPLERAVTTPAEFAIQQEPEAFVLMTRDATDTCRPKRPGQINVPGYGMTDRECGWDKSAFVVQVEPKQGPQSITRYEIDKENGRLVVTSELKGERIPKIQVKRVYERNEPND